MDRDHRSVGTTSPNRRRSVPNCRRSGRVALARWLWSSAVQSVVEESTYVVVVLAVDRAWTAHLTGRAREHEARSFDEDGTEERVRDPHVVAAVDELRIGEAFGTVLHLVGWDAEVLQFVL